MASEIATVGDLKRLIAELPDNMKILCELSGSVITDLDLLQFNIVYVEVIEKNSHGTKFYRLIVKGIPLQLAVRLPKESICLMFKQNPIFISKTRGE